MHTVEEAKKKWCPHARKFGYKFIGGPAAAGAGFNRGAEEHCRCLVAGCMAWRWVENNYRLGPSEKVTHKPTHGYCGLAGQP